MQRTNLAIMTLVAAVMPAASASAQSDPAAQRADEAHRPGATDGTATSAPSDIVVTGNAHPQRRFDADYAVNSLSQQDIQRIAPTSYADLLGNVPGIQVEATGGEVQNITRLRGIPTDRGYLRFQQDGLPLFQDLDGPFFNSGDGMNRYDLMTDHIEVVRGGPAPIYGSQAAGLVNNITVSGSDTPRGRAQLTLGTTGLYRLDAYQAGPLDADTYYAIGGFLRYNDGYRDNGFPNDKGGQIRANIKHDFANGSLKVSGMYVNDHNVFYLPLPIADPNNPSRSLNPYLDYFTGTLNTPALEDVTIRYRDAAGMVDTLHRDLSNGRFMRFGNVGVDFDARYGDWAVSFKSGVTMGRNNFDALYSTNNPADANTYAASFLSAAKKAFGKGVSSLGYAIAGTNGATAYDPYTASGLVVVGQYRAVDSKFYSWQSDLGVGRHLDRLLGSHDVKAGVYAALWGDTQFSAYQDYLLQVAGQPHPLDLIAYSATGAALGYVTDNGAVHDDTTLTKGQVDARVVALYANDTWQITDRLRVDAGIRHEWYAMTGTVFLTAAANLGNAATLADDTTRALTGAVQTNVFDTQATNWTVGGNYDVSGSLGFYARASRLEIPITANTLIATSPVTTASDANQYEVGFKGRFRGSYLYLTGFYTKFSPLNSSFVQYDPTTGRNDQSVKFVGDVVTKGIEADGRLKIDRLFSINASVTVQNPQYRNLIASGAVDLSQVSGNQIIRDPKIYGHVRPNVSFPALNGQLSIYGNYAFVGRRFVDANMLTALPAYQTVGAGAILTTGKWLFQVVGDNVTDAHGLTEGNTRTDAIEGQGTPTATYGRPLFGRSVRFVVSRSW